MTQETNKDNTNIHHNTIIHCNTCRCDKLELVEEIQQGGNNMTDTNVAEVAQQAAEQAAQQAAQQTGQAISEAISKLLQSQTMTTGMSTTQERMGDIGGTERLEKDSMDNSGILFANEKRTYDEYQHESLESIKRNRSYVDKVLSDAHSYDNQARNIANQALQNAVETANMVSKQAVRHGDIAIDHQWNVDEQGYQVAAIMSTLKPVLESVVAQVLADMTKKQQ